MHISCRRHERGRELSQERELPGSVIPKDTRADLQAPDRAERNDIEIAIQTFGDVSRARITPTLGRSEIRPREGHKEGGAWNGPCYHRGSQPGALAQLVERIHGMDEVRSSILLCSTRIETGPPRRSRLAFRGRLRG